MGPTSREDLPQKEQVVTRRPRNPPPCGGGLLVLLGGLPLPPPPLPVRRSLGIGWPSSSSSRVVERRRPARCKPWPPARAVAATNTARGGSRVAPGWAWESPPRHGTPLAQVI